jgi:hypothetical protein
MAITLSASEDVCFIFNLYCDGYGVCYATASKIYVTSDVSIASQRLGIPSNRIVQIRSNTRYHGKRNPSTKCLLVRPTVEDKGPDQTRAEGR